MTSLSVSVVDRCNVTGNNVFLKQLHAQVCNLCLIRFSRFKNCNTGSNIVDLLVQSEFFLSVNFPNVVLLRKDVEVSKLQIEKEIGDGLCISPDTVNTHINNMKKKIKDVNGLSPRTKQELIAYKISTITGKAFDLKKVREYGIQVLLIMINVCSLIHK